MKDKTPAPAVPAQQKFASVARASVLLGLPLRHLKQEVESGSLPAVRVGQRHFVDVAAVEKIMTKRAARGRRQC